MFYFIYLVHSKQKQKHDDEFYIYIGECAAHTVRNAILYNEHRRMCVFTFHAICVSVIVIVLLSVSECLDSAAKRMGGPKKKNLSTR